MRAELERLIMASALPHEAKNALRYEVWALSEELPRPSAIFRLGVMAYELGYALGFADGYLNVPEV